MTNTILLVDDDTDARTIYGHALGEAGYAVLSAGHGGEALALLERVHPCVALVDWYMPVMDGSQLVTAMQSDPRHAAIPIIFVSAARTAPGALAGVAEIIDKPCALDELLAAVARHCPRHA